MYVAVGLILLIFSVGYATMSQYVTNTGAFFAYVGRGLGIAPGVGSAFVSVLAYRLARAAVAAAHAVFPAWAALSVEERCVFIDRIVEGLKARGEELALARLRVEPQCGALRIGDAVQHEQQRWLGHRIERRTTLRWIAAERRVEALLEQRLGAITLATGHDPAPDPKALAAFLAGKVREEGLDLLPLSDASRALLTREDIAAGTTSRHQAYV